MQPYVIKKIFWLWVPVLILAGQIIVELTVDKAILPMFHSEGGPLETLQEIFIFSAFFYGLYSLVKSGGVAGKLEYVWVGLATLCCFYVAGEEISWGQHILDWTTPEFWSEVNDQNETNLHNTSSWLDQKPRLILFIGIVFGGLVIPWLRRFRPSILPARFENYYPANIMVPTALCVLVPYVVDKLHDTLFETSLFTRVSELQETYMYYFVLLYLHVFRKNLIKQKQRL